MVQECAVMMGRPSLHYSLATGAEAETDEEFPSSVILTVFVPWLGNLQ